MAKKIKKYKVGTDSETFAISLVEMPAIESEFVALSKEEPQRVFLESEERHMVYGAALIPDMDIYRNDGEHEYYINFSKESIAKMSQDFMKEYRQHEITLDHEDIANEICVVESWLVEDPYKDKTNALGINVPAGTWAVGMKVNNLEAWERVKKGELKGFSVESLISLEEFGKQNDNNMEIETNEMFWDKLKNILKETFSKKGEEPTPEELAANSGFTSVEDYKEEVEVIKTELEEQNAEPAPTPANEDAANATQNPTDSEPAPVEEPAPEPAPVEEPKVEEPNPLEELVKNLTEEIKALKGANEGLQEKIKDLGKQPSAQPVNTNAKPSAGDTYSAWREQMARYLA